MQGYRFLVKHLRTSYFCIQRKLKCPICLLNSFTDQREFVVKQNSSWISKTVCEEEKQN